MDPLVAKLIYIAGYWIANFVIRAPYIKAHRRIPIRANCKTLLDTVLFVAVSAGASLIALVYVFTPLFAFADYRIPLSIGVLGVAVLLAGDWLFWRAHKDLGTNWSPTLEIREGHTLVAQGIYRRIRHPMYASIWLLLIAQAMILPNYIAGFSGLVPFAVLYFVRVTREEQMMSAAFGSAYEEHRSNTGRLFPKLRRSQSILKQS
jgi:protein-S-isoprenylcysteine O-methyltransferase Ste14